ncbi:XAA-PRO AMINOPEPTIDASE 1, partial [Salix purpurea]
MEENGIDVRDYADVSSDVVLLASDQLDSTSEVKGTVAKVTKTDTAMGNGTNEAGGNNNDRIWVDPGSCCYALYSNLNSEKVHMLQSPLALAKALKNPVELDGLKKAHVRDGAAVVQYLAWLDKQMQESYGASGYFLEGQSANKKKD